MGFNAASAGFQDAEKMVARMMPSENEHILGMVRFMRANGMHAALQRRDGTGVARSYNGRAFANNRYHEKLTTTHDRLSSRGLPDFDVRAVQLLLT
jgi:N-acetylmuramidase